MLEIAQDIQHGFVKEKYMKGTEISNPKDNSLKSPFRIDPSIRPIIDNQGNKPKEEVVKPFDYTGTIIPPGNTK